MIGVAVLSAGLIGRSQSMSAHKDVFLFAGTYPNEAEAHLDYEVLKDLRAEGVVGTYDAAIVTKGDDGKVHVHKHEKPTQHAAWTDAFAASLDEAGSG